MSARGPSILPADFYARRSPVVARALIGTFLVHATAEGRCVGRIVETEAYLSKDDGASHSRSGPTERNASMFGPAARSYIYFTYGMHHCFNLVTGPVGEGEAVLVRALEPVEGVDLMERRRASHGAPARGGPRHLCGGPAKLVQALGIRSEQDGECVTRGSLVLWSRDSLPDRFGAQRRPRIDTATRVGIRRSVDLPLRFLLADSPHVSVKAAQR